MEHVLRSIMLETATAFATAKPCALSSVGRQCKNDSAFFRRLKDPTQSFTARTFDEVMGWLWSNWPEGHEKPFELHRWHAETSKAGATKIVAEAQP